MEEKKLKDCWRNAILEHVPHGADASLQLDFENAIVLSKILLHKGYAVMLTGGDMDDDICVSWLYAGSDDNLDWADKDMVAFFHVDYLEDYPQALEEEYSRSEIDD